MSNGAWDYAANTRGYTVGIVLQYVSPTWSFRYAGALVPENANGPTLASNFEKYNAHVVEVEKTIHVNKRKGSIKVLLFENFANMGNYANAIKN
jgi:high affinity Mn2+ porin